MVGKEVKYENLSDFYKNILQAALKALDNSYNPYSHFFVGSALLAFNGKIVTGTNCENAAYGSTICAERAAILSANTLGLGSSIMTIAIIGKGKDFDVEDIVAPCGACRQMLSELSQRSGIDLDVIMSNTKMTKVVIAKISELLPLAFGPKDLGIEV